MNCGNCNQRTTNCNCSNRSMSNRSTCSERNNCDNMQNNRTVNRNMGCGMHRNTSNNTNCSMHRGTDSMNKCANNNMGCIMKKSINDTGCNMNCKDKYDDKDGCNKMDAPVDKMMPGMSYVPWQDWVDIYDMEEGLSRGTIFAQLDKPFLGRPLK